MKCIIHITNWLLHWNVSQWFSEYSIISVTFNISLSKAEDIHDSLVFVGNLGMKYKCLHPKVIWDVIIHPCLGSYGDWAKSWSTLENGWIISSHIVIWMWIATILYNRKETPVATTCMICIQAQHAGEMYKILRLSIKSIYPLQWVWTRIFCADIIDIMVLKKL